ncbi:MAG: orotidine-5'-phosphate decarboxylase [Treponema sp.]|nr:orotidine-5'-phosphate decarboxylase [Treponema sp.]
MERLFRSVADKGHVCVGLDTAIEHLPPELGSDAGAVLDFNKALVDATCDVAACFKVQIAYYEELGLAGLSVYAETLAYIRKRGHLVIADIKRGDIADTAERYARAHFHGEFQADFVTLSPYLGMDSLEPWIRTAEGKGAFVLMRTSNKGMRDFQCLKVDSGGEARPLYRAVGDRLAELAKQARLAGQPGDSGYGPFGAVVGCTEREEAAEIRRAYPDLFFLIPGYGAQGGGAADAALLLREGNGGVVNASRSILTAWKGKTSPAGLSPLAFAAEAAREEALKMRDAIRGAVAG